MIKYLFSREGGEKTKKVGEGKGGEKERKKGRDLTSKYKINKTRFVLLRTCLGLSR
jgi:hypothetical protein